MRRHLFPPLLLGLVLGVSPVAGQTLAQRVASLGEGRLRFSFAARPGVCASGGQGITMTSVEDDEWEGDCEHGPIRVSLRVRQPRATDANPYIGGPGRRADTGTVDLGTVSAPRTASELLALASASRGDVEELVTAATLADSAVVWPDLLRMARRTDLSLETRRQATFWLSQAAGAAALRGLDSLATDPAGDLEIRKQAVFALSQRPADQGVPALIHIARTSPHPEVRKSALFWLGQSGDPRALALFEELLQ
jgi:hypothetical protein